MAACAVIAFCVATQALAQAFDVASVRASKPGEVAVTSTVPLGPGDVYLANGGNLTARGFPLLTYIAFAYRINDVQLKELQNQAPAWVATERFDIQARTENHSVTKNEMRLMMRALLADRFGLVLHEETRESSVYELTLVKPGTTGAKLRLHPVGEPCSTEPGKVDDETVDGGFPVICGGLLRLSSTAHGHITLGARGISMRLLANSLTGWGQLGRPMVDKTGLNGNVDLVLDYRFEGAPDAASNSDDTGPGFQEALKQQLGLRLQSAKEAVVLLVLDRVNRPTEN